MARIHFECGLADNLPSLFVVKIHCLTPGRVIELCASSTSPFCSGQYTFDGGCFVRLALLILLSLFSRIHIHYSITSHPHSTTCTSILIT
jgi:hypothetical protein